ncbi:MAG: hypothetical protein V8T86_08700 [Victivallis sp.]
MECAIGVEDDPDAVIASHFKWLSQMDYHLSPHSIIAMAVIKVSTFGVSTTHLLRTTGCMCLGSAMDNALQLGSGAPEFHILGWPSSKAMLCLGLWKWSGSPGATHSKMREASNGFASLPLHSHTACPA